MYQYQIRRGRLYQLHPFSFTFLTLTLLVLGFMLAHPLLLLSLLAAVYLDLIMADLRQPARAYLNMGLGMSLLIILINMLFNHNGATVWGRLTIPWLGELVFTQEAFVFAISMSLRLMIILEAFCLLTYLVNPDHIIKYLSRWRGNVALALAICLRLLPALVQKMAQIREIQSCRGIDWTEQGRWSRIKNGSMLLTALLADSLDDAMQMGQTLQTRGFGLGKRSTYRNVLWTAYDSLFVVMVGMGLMIGIFAVVTGQGGFVFYPKLGPIISKDMIMLSLALGTVFSYPAIWSGGWRLWLYFQSEI